MRTVRSRATLLVIVRLFNGSQSIFTDLNRFGSIHLIYNYYN